MVINEIDYGSQCLSQDLKTGCPKLPIVYSDSSQKFVKLNKIRHDILIQCHENYTLMKNINYMVEIDILRNSSQKNWVS